MSARLTYSSFIRSHGRTPRGFGSWCFQRSTSSTAFADELSGDVVTFVAKFSEAAKLARVALSDADLIAVLP